MGLTSSSVDAEEDATTGVDKKWGGDLPFLIMLWVPLIVEIVVGGSEPLW